MSDVQTQININEKLIEYYDGSVSPRTKVDVITTGRYNDGDVITIKSNNGFYVTSFMYGDLPASELTNSSYTLSSWIEPPSSSTLTHQLFGGGFGPSGTAKSFNGHIKNI